MPNLLFICSKNRWRSLTAEALFKSHQTNQARSAGTSQKARVKVNEALINWANIIFVMERKHKVLLTQKFPIIITPKIIVVLDIADRYRFNDPELVILLKDKLSPYLD